MLPSSAAYWNKRSPIATAFAAHCWESRSQWLCPTWPCTARTPTSASRAGVRPVLIIRTNPAVGGVFAQHACLRVCLPGLGDDVRTQRVALFLGVHAVNARGIEAEDPGLVFLGDLGIAELF